MTEPSQTIFALSSGTGRAGVAVFRVSGPAAGTSLTALTGSLPPPRVASLRAVRAPRSSSAPGDLIDHALVIWMPGPASFTGEDSAEIQVHGGAAITRRMLDALGSVPGCRPAEAGEFALRAFENGRIDLAQAEGLADLIDAETDAQRRQALAQSGGAASRRYADMRKAIIDTQALVEAAIDFADEGDVLDQAVNQAELACRDLLADIETALAESARGDLLRDGYQVVLAGPVNAGKSSLLNWFAGHDAAIVTDEAGTTRDRISVHLELNGYPVVMTDTAGLRETRSKAEAIGVARAREAMTNAQLVLWLMPPDATAVPTADTTAALVVEDVGAAGADIWCIATKADLAGSAFATAAEHTARAADFTVSTVTGIGLDDLRVALAHQVADKIGDVEAPLVTQARHRAHLDMARGHVADFLAGDQVTPVELRAEDLRLAAAAIGRITGIIDVEDVLDSVFARFCIGK
ncbi:MAG: tRNA uridine-5-carboxymethylaminomethyl(34) synthesis GTPase MnmE [Pseudomonadota bacterium]